MAEGTRPQRDKGFSNPSYLKELCNAQIWQENSVNLFLVAMTVVHELFVIPQRYERHNEARGSLGRDGGILWEPLRTP